MQKYNLEDRLIDFSVMILEIVDTLPNGFAAKHLGNQLIRSGTSPALNYGEVQSAVSKADFIHRMSICLKELRESLINMKILKKKGYLSGEKIEKTLNECDELVRIFKKSIQTAKQRAEEEFKA
jgi:four helix bundle protein